jgi:hypothetical protein
MFYDHLFAFYWFLVDWFLFIG